MNQGTMLNLKMKLENRKTIRISEFRKVTGVTRSILKNNYLYRTNVHGTIKTEI